MESQNTEKKQKYQKELDLEIALKGLQEEDLTDEEYLEEVQRIVKCNEEVDTEEVIGEKEIIVSDTDPDAEGYFRVGIWYHHANGYFYEWAVTAINIMFLISIALLLGGLRRNQSHEKKRLLRFLLYGTIGLLITNSLVGYFLSNEELPPYLIIFESILSAIILVVSAFRYRLLPSIMSRYEMIFNLTPTSILMLNSDLEIMELNDNAKKMFRWKQNAERNLYELLRRGHNQLQIEMIVKELEVNSTMHDATRNKRTFGL